MFPKRPVCTERLVNYYDTIKYFGSELFHVRSYIMFQPFFHWF